MRTFYRFLPALVAAANGIAISAAVHSYLFSPYRLLTVQTIIVLSAFDGL